MRWSGSIKVNKALSKSLNEQFNLLKEALNINEAQSVKSSGLALFLSLNNESLFEK